MEIERTLHERRIDLAVHSLKDLPTAQPPGLRIVVAGPREDVRDVLVWNSSTLSQSPRPPQGVPQHITAEDAPTGSDTPWWCQAGGCQGASLRIGTGSLRRTAQIHALYPNAQILPLRGNVDTRIRKLEAGDYDSIVLASAGLHRLAMQERLAGRLTYLPIELMMPAPGQGALALEIRDEPEMHALLAPISDPISQTTTSSERMFMRRLGAGCYLPVAAYGEIANESLTLRGLVISLDGQRQVRVNQSIPWTAETSIECAEQLGVGLAEQALARGAAEIISALNANREQERQHA